jgi:general secretion pathway protein D
MCLCAQLPLEAQNPPQQPTTTRAPNQGSQPPPTARVGQAGEEEVMIKLPDADIDTMLSALEIYTGKTILRPHTLLPATYNLKIEKRIPKAKAIIAIETVLALNNIGLAPLDDMFLKVVNLQNVRQESPELIDGSTLGLPPTGRVAVKVFQLEFLRTAEVVPLLQGILNPVYGAPVQLANANALLVTDTITALQRVERLLLQLDKPVMTGLEPKFYSLSEAKASDVVTKIRGILQGTMPAQLGQSLSYSADDNTNQIILIADPRQHGLFDRLIHRLDQRPDPNTRTDVIPLNHAKAAEVATVINHVIKGQSSTSQRQSSIPVRPSTGQGLQPGPPAAAVAPAPPSTAMPTMSPASSPEGSNEFSSYMTVVSDERSNSVVVNGTFGDIRLVRSLIEKLDIVLAQVRIEIVIAEVLLDDQAQSGISALGLTLDGDKLVGFAGATSGESLTIANGVVARPGTSGPRDLAAEISIATTPRKTNSTILSVPAIVTSHGKPGVTSNGEKRPIVTGSVNSGISGGTTSTTSYQQIGTTLTVTPFIGVDGSVQLDLKQTVEDVTGRVIVDGNEQPIVGSREMTSYTTAKSGQVIVLGGFTKRINSATTSRLGPIPIIGDIFGSRSKQSYRQELIFFLRPTVLTNNSALDNAPALNRVDQFPTRDDIRGYLQDDLTPIPSSRLDSVAPR